MTRRCPSELANLRSVTTSIRDGDASLGDGEYAWEQRASAHRESKAIAFAP